MLNDETSEPWRMFSDVDIFLTPKTTSSSSSSSSSTSSSLSSSSSSSSATSPSLSARSSSSSVPSHSRKSASKKKRTTRPQSTLGVSSDRLDGADYSITVSPPSTGSLSPRPTTGSLSLRPSPSSPAAPSSFFSSQSSPSVSPSLFNRPPSSAPSVHARSLRPASTLCVSDSDTPRSDPSTAFSHLRVSRERSSSADQTSELDERNGVGAALFGGKKSKSKKKSKSRSMLSVFTPRGSSDRRSPPASSSSSITRSISFQVVDSGSSSSSSSSGGGGGGGGTLGRSSGASSSTPPVQQLSLDSVSRFEPGPLSPITPETRTAFYLALSMEQSGEQGSLLVRDISDSLAGLTPRGGREESALPSPRSSAGSIGSHAASKREATYREELKIFQALDLFNQSPQKGLLNLVTVGLVLHNPDAIAHFFLRCRYLSKDAVGIYLSENNEFNQLVCTSFLRLMDFKLLDFDLALRRFLTSLALPGEAQRIDRLMRAFAASYFAQNAAAGTATSFADEKAVHSLAFALIMLNTDAHSANVHSKMTLAEFVRNLEGFNGGKDFAADYLAQLYERITANEIQSQTELQRFPNATKMGWLHFKPKNAWTWSRRWFVLSDHTLYILKKPKAPTPTLALPLADIETFPLSKTEAKGRPYVLLMRQSPRAPYQNPALPVWMSGTSDADIHQWLRAIDSYRERSDADADADAAEKNLPKASSSFL